MVCYWWYIQPKNVQEMSQWVGRAGGEVILQFKGHTWEKKKGWVFFLQTLARVSSSKLQCSQIEFLLTRYQLDMNRLCRG